MARTAAPVIVVGAGIAGLSVALDLAPRAVVVLTPSPLGKGVATGWAQGGIAAALGPDDSPALHASDTLAAAAGIGDREVAGRVAAAAPAAIERLIARGVVFDHNAEGHLSLGLEAAHCRRRIVHAGGDATGAVVMAALVATARATPSITIEEGARAVSLCVVDGRVTGVEVERDGRRQVMAASAVVLATGGTGALYANTTNPLSAVGSGIALAARAGAELRDMEFVQFHPTAIVAGRDPMPLASEAVRGEGAILVNDRGERFMADVPGAELAPRDVVARAIAREIAAGRAVFLDAREALGAAFADRFPSVAALCRDAGIDPAKDPIPVRPAAHYHMGGVAIDGRGRTTVAGLWACGEVSASGLHGANRLASNSLLEGLVFARWIADDIAGRAAETIAPRPAISTAAAIAMPATDVVRKLRQLMTEKVGVVRDNAGLRDAIDRLASAIYDPRPAIADRALVGLAIAVSAQRRLESRGGHYRADHPTAVDSWAKPSRITLGELYGVAQIGGCVAPPRRATA
ncbi:MAG: L-aspartate oxidase [Gemmatimonas sp.]